MRSSIACPSAGWRFMTTHSAGSSLPRLVEDLVGDAQLADVVQERAELQLALVARVELKLLADLERERQHALAVLAAGVRVVGLEHLAHQQRGAAVGVRELERVL